MTITCPHCGFAKETAPRSIPPGAASAVCPACRQRFALADQFISSDKTGLRPEDPAPGFEPDRGTEASRVSGPPPPPAFSGAAADDDSPPAPRLLDFRFTGRASEYFGIWIVNILLKIVTLGIYSAWAKVRKRRYFYGNTLLDDSPFSYLAEPLALFKGWLIGAGLFILYLFGTRVSTLFNLLFLLLFFAVTPWLIVRTRIFNQRNSEHRGIRLSFRANYREAYLVFAGLPLLLPFTLGLLTPYMVYRQKRFFVENSSYGQTAFTFTATAEDFYQVFVKGLGIFILILGIFFFGIFGLSLAFMGGASLLQLTALPSNPASLQKSIAVAFALLMLLIGPLYLTFAVYLETALANLTWNGTALGSNRLVSSLRVPAIIWIRFSNVLAIFLTLGLMTPWASIRMARYRFAHLKVRAADELALFRAAPREEIGAAGEEIGDIFGIDIAL